MPALAVGVLTGLGKRPRRDAVLPRTRLVVPGVRTDRRRLAAYAEVCGFARGLPSAHPARGRPGDRPGPPSGSPAVEEWLPLTYPHVLGFPLAARLMASRAFPLPLLGLVHTSIEITQRTRLNADDVLELSVHAEELRPHRRGTEAVIVTEARREGVPVWRDLSTYLARGPVASTDRANAVPDGPRTGEPRTEASLTEGPRTGEPRTEGTLPHRATWRLPAGLGRRHAAVSGDYNPIHLHPWTARPLGFRRAIAHGMWTFARCVAETDAASADEVTVRAEFRSPVLLPSATAYAADGPAFELRSADDPGRLHVRGEVTLPQVRP
ncbi:MaoC/PaaZ C-terminal domain-containing protein [Streptomyces sp. NPDC047108]|uniref:MaoC/PaaZ C-terminal domain-containing protein n=1 Tax=Streptomyces sp. NPDC047108 TaxID=3155025 RepID=UPI0033CD1F2A